MSGSRRRSYEVRVTFPATLEALEEVLRRTHGIWERHQVQSEHFAIELLLREALTNAVVHGCSSDPTKSIRFRLRRRPGRVTFAVEDQGRGFRWDSEASRICPVRECSGRGLQILDIYASRVRFNRLGNLVTVVKELAAGNQ